MVAMTRDEALSGLESASSHARTQAARFFAESGTKEDISILKKALASESDEYVRRRLNLAIKDLQSESDDSGSKSTAAVTNVNYSDEGLARAIQWVGGLLLHEMELPIGRIGLSASKEIPRYGESNTKAELEGLRSVFVGIGELLKVSRAPKPQEFDLAKLLRDTVALEVQTPGGASLVGSAPLLTVTDPDFLRLAIVNGLRNAVEAVREVGADIAVHPIVVSWGVTDRDYWISIVDSGPGLVGPVPAKFEIGKTTKSGHSGFGLAVARRAMDSLGGKLSLQPAENGGARYELSWARKR